MSLLKLERLTPDRFAPFGDVIEMHGRDWFPINSGTTRRYHDLGRIQVQSVAQEGTAGISLAQGDAFQFPLNIRLLERHPLGSQAWIPFNQTPFIAVVAPDGAGDRPDEAHIRAFYVGPDQGVNYRAGTWHHPLMALGQPGEFVVIDRIGSTPNCDEYYLHEVRTIDGSFVDEKEARLLGL